MIKNITLTNFRNHTHKTFEFEPKVNIIVGPNGSGKTSILLALQTVLFGSRPLPLKHMVSTGASAASVQVNYNALSVFRSFGEESAYNISKDGNNIASGAKDCESYLQGIFGSLGMLVAAPQTNQLYPLDNQKVLDEFFDFTVYQEAFKHLLLPLRELEKELGELQNRGAVLSVKQEELDRKNWYLLNLQSHLAELEEPEKPNNNAFIEITNLANKIEQNEHAFGRLGVYIDELNNDSHILKNLKKEQEDYDYKLATYHASIVGDGDNTWLEIADELDKNECCPVCGAGLVDGPYLAERIRAGHKQPMPTDYPVDFSERIMVLEQKITKLPEMVEERVKLDKIILKDRRKLAELEGNAENERVKAKVYRDWEIGVATTKSNIASTEQEIEDLAQALSQLPALDTEIESLEKKIESLKEIRETVRSIPDKLREGVSEYLQKGLRSHLQTAPCLKLDKLEIDGFLPVINGLTLNLLSGAQQATVAVIMRVLLCQLIGSPIFIMDEPTNNMDKDTKPWFVDFINRLDFEQVIVVTHDDLIDGDNVIRLGE